MREVERGNLLPIMTDYYDETATLRVASRHFALDTRVDRVEVLTRIFQVQTGRMCLLLQKADARMSDFDNHWLFSKVLDLKVSTHALVTDRRNLTFALYVPVITSWCDKIMFTKTPVLDFLAQGSHPMELRDYVSLIVDPAAMVEYIRLSPNNGTTYIPTGGSK